MLEQHAALGIHRKEPGRTEPPPVPRAVVGHDPRITGVSRTARAPWLAGFGLHDRHRLSLSHPMTTWHR